MLALLVQLEATCTAADNLAEEVEEAFPQHPDAEIILSFRGLGTQLGARVLAEIGDDRQRFADARGLKAYAGASPITRASGKKSSITRRWVKNDRLNHAGYLWAFSAITASPGAQGPLPAPPRQPRRLARRRPAQRVQPHDRPALPLPPTGSAI
jgi:transposase